MKKSRLFFACVAFIFAAMVNAEPVGLEAARKLASGVLGGKGLTDVALNAEVSSRMAVSPVESPAFYMFNSEDGKGFVIVSGDDTFPEVVGYSDSGRLSADGAMPDALVAYLEGYSRYVEDVRKGVVAPPVREGVGVAGTSSVEPLCSSTWGQGYPYNGYTPVIGTRVCPVGCVATAMAQIMYKYKHPERAAGGLIFYDTGNTSIGTNGYLIENFSTDDHIYNWDLMRDDASQMLGSANAASRNAVAQLSYDCGVATNMQYAIGGSGTSESEALYALHTYFGYSKATTDLVFRNTVSTQTEWNAMVKKELDEGRPMLYCGSSFKGSGSDAAGHAFIVDGYDKTGKVHVNWGWDGDCDGYFDITTLDMGEYAFSENQSIIYGINPAVEGEKAKQSRLLMFFEPMSIMTTSAMLGRPAFVTLVDFYNMYGGSKHWYLTIGLYDKHGRFIQAIGGESDLEELGYGWGYTEFLCRVTMPAGLADGDYALRIMINEDGFNLPSGERDWILPLCYGGDAANWCPVMVSGGKAYFGQVSTPVEDVEIENADVVSRQYFDINGRAISSPNEGVVIEKQTLSNGKSRIVKRIF